MTIAEDQHTERRRKELSQQQPLKWDWIAVLSFVSAGLCAVALWKGIVWVGMVAYRYWH